MHHSLTTHSLINRLTTQTIRTDDFLKVTVVAFCLYKKTPQFFTLKLNKLMTFFAPSFFNSSLKHMIFSSQPTLNTHYFTFKDAPITFNDTQFM